LKEKNDSERLFTLKIQALHAQRFNVGKGGDLPLQIAKLCKNSDELAIVLDTIGEKQQAWLFGFLKDPKQEQERNRILELASQDPKLFKRLIDLQIQHKWATNKTDATKNLFEALVFRCLTLQTDFKTEWQKVRHLVDRNDFEKIMSIYASDANLNPNLRAAAKIAYKDLINGFQIKSGDFSARAIKKLARRVTTLDDVMVAQLNRGLQEYFQNTKHINPLDAINYLFETSRMRFGVAQGLTKTLKEKPELFKHLMSRHLLEDLNNKFMSPTEKLFTLKLHTLDALQKPNLNERNAALANVVMHCNIQEEITMVFKTMVQRAKQEFDQYKMQNHALRAPIKQISSQDQSDKATSSSWGSKPKPQTPNGKGGGHTHL